MMRDNSNSTDGSPRMVLLAIDQTYWLAEGEEFLTPMLHGSGFFPKPVTCVIFPDLFELRAYIGPGRSVVDFWGINADIVERLRRDGHLTEVLSHSL